MELNVTSIGSAYYVLGNTFDVKHILKRNGATWDSFRQGWKFKDEVQARLAAVEATSQLEVLAELAAFE